MLPVNLTSLNLRRTSVVFNNDEQREEQEDRQSFIEMIKSLTNLTSLDLSDVDWGSFPNKNELEELHQSLQKCDLL